MNWTTFDLPVHVFAQTPEEQSCLCFPWLEHREEFLHSFQISVGDQESTTSVCRFLLQKCRQTCYIRPDRPFLLLVYGGGQLIPYQEGCDWKFLTDGYHLYVRGGDELLRCRELKVVVEYM
mgnify:CR=1 FL=1